MPEQCPHADGLRARARLPAMLCDNALAFDPATRCCDLVFDGADLAIDTTPLTPMLIIVGCSRRARPDDTLPTGTTDIYDPKSLLARQGWAGDAFDQNGQLIGCRFWLLDGAKDVPASYSLASTTIAEGLAPLQALGYVTGVKTGRLRKGVLGAIVAVETSQVTLSAVMT